MELFWKINDIINGFVWGKPMVVLLTITGMYLTFSLCFLPWRNICNGFKMILKPTQNDEQSGISPRAALFTALSATVGTGNIAGVASAIYIGGPGAVFYMWFIALFGMATKYSEVFLAIKYREKNSKGEWVGGPMYYLRNGLSDKSPHLGKIMAVLFAIFTCLAAMGMNGVQANSISEVMNSTFSINTNITGGAVMIIAGLVIIGGIKRISEYAEKLVPFMIVLYVVIGTIVLLINIHHLPHAIGSIFTEAFNFQAAGGGAIGAAIMIGFKRGIFSNEAGLGSAPIAHAASKTKDPMQQGIIAMTGVFIDTIVVCTFTALIILSSGIYQPGNGIQGASLTAESFKAVIPFGDVVVALSLGVFAFTTILGWAYYGEKAIEYLVKNETIVYGYRVCYILFIYFASISSLESVWKLADTFNGMMAIPNLIALLLLSPVVIKHFKESKNFKENKK